MSEQLIIALGREFGSGGHEIARTLAGRFSLPLYEKNILEEIARARGLDAGGLAPYDERPKNHLMYRTVNGFSNAPGDVIAQMQFEYLRERAEVGASFVVLGRCAEEVLRGRPGLVSIFVLADRDFKLARTMERGAASQGEAQAILLREDRRRKLYHDQFCKGKWGTSRNYDLTVNSARLGIQGTADILEQYIRARMAALSAES